MGRVEIYRNIRKQCYSVRDKTSGLVIEHTLGPLTLENCVLKVSQAGRQRVLAKKRKNVHAWIEGDIVDTPDVEWNTLSYNPYKNETFIDKTTGSAIYSAQYVMLTAEGARYKK